MVVAGVRPRCCCGGGCCHLQHVSAVVGFYAAAARYARLVWKLSVACMTWGHAPWLRGAGAAVPLSVRVVYELHPAPPRAVCSPRLSVGGPGHPRLPIPLAVTGCAVGWRSYLYRGTATSQVSLTYVFDCQCSFFSCASQQGAVIGRKLRAGTLLDMLYHAATWMQVFLHGGVHMGVVFLGVATSPRVDLPPHLILLLGLAHHFGDCRHQQGEGLRSADAIRTVGFGGVGGEGDGGSARLVNSPSGAAALPP